MRIRFTSSANRDLQSIGDYFQEISPLATGPIFGAIERCFARLSLTPYLGRGTDMGSVRCLVVPRYPYKIFYRIAGDTVEVLTVFHTSQDPDNALSQDDA